MARRSRVSEKEITLLAALEEDGDFVRACSVAGVPRRTGYFWRSRYPDFAEKCTLAIAVGSDRKHREEWKPVGSLPPEVSIPAIFDRLARTA